jgi:hypothetical protein
MLKDAQNIELRRGDAPSVEETVNFHVEPLAEAHGQHCGIGFRVGAVVGAGLATFFMLEPHIEKYMFSTNIVRTRKLTPLGMATCRMFS